MRTADSGELMRMMLLTMLQSLVDAEATAHIGADRHQRTEGRMTQRNGTRDKIVSTTAGDLTVKIPKLRAGSFFPWLLEPRRRIDVALHAVVMQARVEGVRPARSMTWWRPWASTPGSARARCPGSVPGSTSRSPPGGPGRWPARPSRTRSEHATYRHGRVGGDAHGKGRHATSRAVVIATGVSADGRREVLGCQVGDSEDEVSPAEFLRELRERGLGGVRLVINDSHAGLRKAITRTMSGAAWQRCRVHAMRNLLAKAPKNQAEWVAAAVRTIFAQPDATAVRAQVETVATSLQTSLPDIARTLRDARTDLTAFADFPVAHWRKIWPTNPLERLNREVKRRTDVVGIFPDDNALLRLTSCVLMKAHDEWQVVDEPPLPLRSSHGARRRCSCRWAGKCSGSARIGLAEGRTGVHRGAPSG